MSSNQVATYYSVDSPRREEQYIDEHYICPLIYSYTKVCVCVCVCVCVHLYGPTSGDNFVGFFFYRMSADTRGVGTSAVVRPMPINVLSIFKHIYKYSQCNFLNLPPNSS